MFVPSLLVILSTIVVHLLLSLVSWAEMCSLKIYMLKPSTSEVTLFGDRFFKDVIKVK